MNRQVVMSVLLVLALVLLVMFLLPRGQALAPATPAAPDLPAEIAVTPIPLGAPLDSGDAEISGLAWYGDTLILLPQYPNFTSEYTGAGEIYALAQGDIQAYLDGITDGPLTPVAIPLDAAGLDSQLEGYEGLEAITFDGDTVYASIETEGDDGPLGYIVTGTIEPDLSAVTLDPDTLHAIPPQSESGNKSEEAITLIEGNLLTFYEVSGAALNQEPVAHVLNPDDLADEHTIPFPRIEYRVTDATSADDGGCFWVINYNFPGDEDLQTQDDPVVEQFGEGETHAATDIVERLIQLCYTGDEVVMADAEPIYLELLPSGDARNWEGLVQLEDRGFLIATDKFPETILAYVPVP